MALVAPIEGRTSSVSLRAMLSSALCIGAVSCCAFCWSLSVAVITLYTTMKDTTAFGAKIPTSYFVLGFWVATSVAAVSVGLMGARLRHAGAALAAATGGLVGTGMLMALRTLHCPWLVHLKDTHYGNWVWCLLAASFAASGVAGNGWASRQGAHGAHDPRSAETTWIIRWHIGVFLALWVVPGYLSYGGLAEILMVTGALLFAFHSYPRLRHFPAVRPHRNLLVVIPAAYGLWIALRDFPRIIAGTRIFGSPEAGYPVKLTFLPTHGLSIPSAVALCAATAIAVSVALNHSRSTGPAPDHSSALRHGGLALIALSPLPFFTMKLQALPLALLMLLYSYYLFASVRRLRPFVGALVTAAAWVPLGAFWQYAAHYMALAQGGHTFPPPWSYMAGCGEPFNWHDDLGPMLSVALLLLYGLLRTSRARWEQACLKWLGVLIAVAIVLTFARGAWLSFLLMLTVGPVWLGGRKLWWVPALVVAGVSALAIAQLSGAVHVQHLLGRSGSTFDERISNARLAWEVLKAHPLVGVAPWQWDRLWMAAGFREYGLGNMVVGWLQVVVEGGVIGVALFAVLVGTMGRKLLRAVSLAMDPEDSVLMKCMVLAVLLLALNNWFTMTLSGGGGLIMFSMLSGAVLGCGASLRADSEHQTLMDRPSVLASAAPQAPANHGAGVLQANPPSQAVSGRPMVAVAQREGPTTSDVRRRARWRAGRAASAGDGGDSSSPG